MKKQIFFMALVLCTQLNAQTTDTTKTLKEVVITYQASKKTFLQKKLKKNQ
jgi:hypothetical protein